MNPSPIAQEYLEKGQSLSCPLIDMHGHLGPFWGAWLPSAPLNKMQRRLERCGVQRIVCSSHAALAYDVEGGNALMQEVINAHADQFLGYWVINPNYSNVVEKDLRNFDRLHGFVGLKFWPDYHLVPVTSPKYAPALAFANERRLLVLVHTWGESLYDAPALLGEVAARYPHARFLMGHSGHGEWETSVKVARELPNVYLDLTSVPNPHDFRLMPGGALTPREPMSSPQVNGLIEFLVAGAGSEKIVFGSDLPWYSEHYHTGAVLFARITDEDRHNILHRNAEKLLGSYLNSTPNG